MRLNMRKILLLILTLFCVLSLSAQVNKKLLQDFPWTYNLVWGGASRWVYTQFDFNNVPATVADRSWYLDAQTLAGTKVDSIIWHTTGDWNLGQPIYSEGNGSDTAYRVHIVPYGFISYSGGYLIDITNYCPQISRAPFNGRRYNEYLADTIAQVNTYFSVLDGISSDGTWGAPYGHLTDCDLDRDGQADYSETAHGATVAAREAWIYNTWRAGYVSMVTRLKSKDGWANKYITYWTCVALPPYDTLIVSLANGVGWENAAQNVPLAYDDINWDPPYIDWRTIAQHWNAQTTPSPRLNLVSATFWVSRYFTAAPNYPYGTAGSLAYDTLASRWWRYMRWTLAMAGFTNSYYQLQLYDGSGGGGIYDHAATLVYDEYEANLGQPATPDTAYYIKNNTVIVKFFTKGALIGYFPQSIASSPITTTVTTADISSLAGYSAPYYKLYGNQDTTTNNGGTFSSVTLTATSSGAGGDGTRWFQPIGDAILLSKSADTAVTKIIINNAVMGTTAGSVPTTFIGNHNYNSADRTGSNPYFSAGGYPYSSGNTAVSSQIAERLGGATTDTAIFTPKINRAGYWRVSEWHGHLTGATEVSNVPCRIWYSGGYKDTTINQTINVGQWNILGTYPYTATSNHRATLAGTGTGIPMVDAFMWEYIHGQAPQILTEPTVQASIISYTNVGSTSMTVNFTTGNGSNRILLVKQGSAVNSNPVDSTNYTANTVFGSGSQIGTGNYVVYNSTGTTVTITGLTAATTYYFALYEFNSVGGYANYLQTSPSTGNRTTTNPVSDPTVQAAISGFSNVDTTSMRINLVAGNGTNRILLMRQGSAVNSDPVDFTSYTANTVFRSGSQIGTGNYVVYNGTGTSVTVTGLTVSTVYYYAVYEFNSTGGSNNYYLTTSAGTANKITASRPTSSHKKLLTKKR